MSRNKPRLTRKQSRSLKMQNVLDQNTNYTRQFRPRIINPVTDNQQKVFDAYENKKHLHLMGYAGTGKSFLSCYLGIRDVLDGYYDKLIIVRSAVPTRDIGFLPGKQDDKTAVYEAPYKQIFGQLFQRGDAYEILKQKMSVEFLPTSYVRGITIDNAVVMVDECQNMNDHEMNSIITRLGRNCRLIVCGDMRQSDLYREESGFKQTVEIFSKMKSMAMIEFQKEDIVRSGFVKEYIIAREYVRESNIQYRPSRVSKAQESNLQREATLREAGRKRISSVSISDVDNLDEVAESYQGVAS
jgi:phosphate starvation-inducible PhoH-like protein